MFGWKNHVDEEDTLHEYKSTGGSQIILINVTEILFSAFMQSTYISVSSSKKF